MPQRETACFAAQEKADRAASGLPAIALWQHPAMKAKKAMKAKAAKKRTKAKHSFSSHAFQPTP
jgi:hypothetical protein